MNNAEAAFDERDILTEGYARVLKYKYYNTQIAVALWSNCFRFALHLGVRQSSIRAGQQELESCGFYWTGD